MHSTDGAMKTLNENVEKLRYFTVDLTLISVHICKILPADRPMLKILPVEMCKILAVDMCMHMHNPGIGYVHAKSIPGSGYKWCACTILEVDVCTFMAVDICHGYMI